MTNDTVETHWCSHCDKETPNKVVRPTLYGVAMSHRQCVVCGYSVEFAKPGEHR